MSDTTAAPTDIDQRHARVLRLTDPQATDRDLVGGKAAALAEAVAAGVRTLPGVVLTTAFCDEIDGGTDIPGHPAIEDVLRSFEPGTRLVARSSSVVEDASESSEAGQFESVIGIDGRDELEDAVRVVLDSRERARAMDHPIAVLVQPMVEPSRAGVMFGVDPVTGRIDRRVVNVVEGQPDPLVSGEVEGSSYELDHEGEVVDEEIRDGVRLPGSVLLGLAQLADRVADVFGGPQDVEWAVVDGELVLLQSRPVTTTIRGVPQGPVYGPGPVAETFPEPLSRLEQDLWIPPLRDAVAEALRLAGAVKEDDLDGPDLVTVVDGWAAIDLERTGEIETERTGGGGLGVVGRIRRLRSAWRLGRLRSALPELGHRLLRQVDDDLEDLPPLTEVSDRQLVGLLARSHQALRSLHAHEILMGRLGEEGRGRLTGASVAMRVLTEARSDGRSDAEILRRSPVVLALCAPRICRAPELPDPATTPEIAPRVAAGRTEAPRATDPAVVREALRLRVRWVQELTARAAWELGERLARSGHLDDPEHVRLLSLDDLVALTTKRGGVIDPVLRAEAHDRGRPDPLPARFRLSAEGRPVPYVDGDGGGGGTGAGGGRGSGPVTHDADDPPKGSVLVVTTLHPGIGPLLPRLNGLVAETGSVLAHLAILARESGVPTVVGHAGAVEQLEEGQVVTVDGHSGEVTVGGDDEEEDRS